LKPSRSCSLVPIASEFRIWNQVYLNIWKQVRKDLYQPHMYPWPME
jgi:hypothetical protein